MPVVWVPIIVWSSTHSPSSSAALPYLQRRYTWCWVRPLVPAAIDSTPVLSGLSRSASPPGSSSSSHMDPIPGRWTCSLPTRCNCVLLGSRQRILYRLLSVQPARTRTYIHTVPRVKRLDGEWPLWRYDNGMPRWTVLCRIHRTSVPAIVLHVALPGRIAERLCRKPLT